MARRWAAAARTKPCGYGGINVDTAIELYKKSCDTLSTISFQNVAYIQKECHISSTRVIYTTMTITALRNQQHSFSSLIISQIRIP